MCPPKCFHIPNCKGTQQLGSGRLWNSLDEKHAEFRAARHGQAEVAKKLLAAQDAMCMLWVVLPIKRQPMGICPLSSEHLRVLFLLLLFFAGGFEGPQPSSGVPPFLGTPTGEHRKNYTHFEDAMMPRSLMLGWSDILCGISGTELLLSALHRGQQALLGNTETGAGPVLVSQSRFPLIWGTFRFGGWTCQSLHIQLLTGWAAC